MRVKVVNITERPLQIEAPSWRDCLTGIIWIALGAIGLCLLWLVLLTFGFVGVVVLFGVH